VTPLAKREAATRLVTECGLSVQRACRIVRFSRAAYYRQGVSRLERDAPVIEALRRLVERHSKIGFWKSVDRLHRRGYPWNPKRIYRVYRALGLNQARRTKRRVPTRLRQPLAAVQLLNVTWAMDFMSDAFYGGRKFRVLNAIDEGNREVLAIEPATSIPTARVLRVLNELVQMHGAPAALRVDNGPEFTSGDFVEWCGERGIEIRFIQPGKPDQNAFIERFNRTYREGVLDTYLFASIEEVKAVSAEWMEDYNWERPHDSLGRVPPLTFLPRPTASRESTLQLST